MVQGRILTYFKVNDKLRRCFVVLDNSYSSTTTKKLLKKKHLNVNTIKLNFVKKTSSKLHPVKRRLKYQEL